MSTINAETCHHTRPDYTLKRAHPSNSRHIHHPCTDFTHAQNCKRKRYMPATVRTAVSYPKP